MRAQLSDAQIEARLAVLGKADEALGQRLEHDAQVEQIRAKCRIARAVAAQ